VSSAEVERGLTGVKCLAAVFPPDPALLHPAPRRAGVITVVCVHPDEAGFYRASHTMRAREVRRPEPGPEAVLAVVRQRNTFRFTLCYSPVSASIPTETQD
jgi:hypothetical protein